MDIFKVKLETTNGLKDTACNRKNEEYIEVDNGFIYVTKRDLNYVMENFKFISIEAVGLIYERPCEMRLEERN